MKGTTKTKPSMASVVVQTAKMDQNPSVSTIAAMDKSIAGSDRNLSIGTNSVQQIQMQTGRRRSISTTDTVAMSGGKPHPQDLRPSGGSASTSAKTSRLSTKSGKEGAKSAKHSLGSNKKSSSKGETEEGRHDSKLGDIYDVKSDEIISAFHQVEQKVEGPRVIRRSSGYAVLDQFRLGPDVLDGDLECTPLPLFTGFDTLRSYSKMLNKLSAELIPQTPKNPAEEFSLTNFDIRMYQQQSRSPAMSWQASLTTLEEEEFQSEMQHFECFKIIHNLPVEAEVEKVYLQKVVNINNVDGTVSTKRRVRVVLSECETTFLIQVTGKFELESNENFEEIKKRNEHYRVMVQHHLESDAYSNRFAQTFENRSRDQWSQYSSPAACDVAVQANYFMIEDEYEAVHEADSKRKIREEEEAQIKMLQERLRIERDAIEAIHNSDEDDSDEEDKGSSMGTIDWNKYGNKYDDAEDDEDDDENYKDIDEKEFELSDNDDEFDTVIPLEEIYARQEKKTEAATLTVLPDISMGVVFMDRLISMEYMQDNQADMRGFPILNANLDANDKKDNKPHFFNLIEDNRGKQERLDLGPNIKRYWSLKTTVTKGREVTDIALHNLNGNIVAASYGSNRFGDDEEGMVCVWSAKNTFYPERIYEFKSSVTCLAFANLTPYLLAIGMLDGNLVVYDVRAPQPVAISSTIGSQQKHQGPIWQVHWFQETEMATTGSINEVLLSLGDDGVLNRWSQSKGFDLTAMLRVRRSPLRIPGRREKRAEALTSNLSVGFSLCFYPGDWTQYLIGTEEGFIHKCSTSFTDQFMTSYIGHTGPVYRICFNTFDRTIFVSASADWSVKVWREGTTAPLLSMQTGLRTMYDVTCCPTMSSVFVCASEFHVEVWDLTLNTLEPVVQFAPPFAVGFRRAAYSSYLNSVILGDDEGAITFYGLRDFPSQPAEEQEQIDQLLEGLMPGYKKARQHAVDEQRLANDIMNPPRTNFPPPDPQIDQVQKQLALESGAAGDAGANPNPDQQQQQQPAGDKDSNASQQDKGQIPGSVSDNKDAKNKPVASLVSGSN